MPLSGKKHTLLGRTVQGKPIFYTPPPNFWNLFDNPYNKTISNFNVIYADGQVDIDWGTVISGNIPSATNINHTFGITTQGISILARNGASITQINCGTSSPRLGGTVDISAFPNLQQFRCSSNDITALSGYTGNPNLISIIFNTNQVTGSIPNLSSLTNLQNFQCHTNQLTGPIPNLSTLTNLSTFQCMINQLTGSIPSLSALTNLVNFYCNTNQLTGPIPSLSASTNLVNFHCYTNQLTGPIPSLSTLINLQEFRCNSNQFTGFNGGSVSNTLGYFDARVNQLTSAAVNAILAAFVAANKTTGTKVLLLGGTGNGAPTGQGITDKATLISRGWTVTTN
jgi:hypothetical protein